MIQTAKRTRELLRQFMASLERRMAAHEVAKLRERASSARTSPNAMIGTPPVMARPDGGTGKDFPGGSAPPGGR